MVRPAIMSDVEAICGLVNYFAQRGKMLHRSSESVYESLRDFVVAEHDGHVAGCVGLSMSWKDLGEIRSLAVAPDCQGLGIGRKLIEQVVADGRRLGLKRVFALTYEPEFFAKFGFKTVDKETLPTKVWRDCIHCQLADACAEVAMVMDLE